MKPYRYLPLAEEEYTAQVDFYLDSSLARAIKFEATVIAAIENIRMFPESAPESEPGIRRRVLKDFPISLHYKNQAAQIVIVAFSIDTVPLESYQTRTTDL